MVFILLINVKKPTINDILTFISRMNFVLSWVEHEKSFITSGSVLEIIKLSSCSTQMCMEFDMLIIVKMPTVVDILTFISIINEKFECFKQEKICISNYFSQINELKFHGQLS